MWLFTEIWRWNVFDVQLYMCVAKSLWEAYKVFIVTDFNHAPETLKLPVHFCVLPFLNKDNTKCFAKIVDVNQSKEENEES